MQSRLGNCVFCGASKENVRLHKRSENAGHGCQITVCTVVCDACGRSITGKDFWGVTEEDSIHAYEILASKQQRAQSVVTVDE